MSSQVCICQARISTVSPSESDSILDSGNSAGAASSQETLVLELNTIVNELIAAGKPAPITTNLQSLFDNIEALDVLIDVALKLYNFSSLYKPILYTLQKRVFSRNDAELIYYLSDILIKVDLIEYILFRGNNNYESINLQEINCKQLCIAFISKMDFDIASICWLKYSELKLSLSSEDIIQILNAIPCNTKMSAIMIWFKNFVPSLLEQNPFYIDLFVRWAMERIFILEQSSYWPKIGLKFIEEIATVLESSLKIICIRPISMDDLDVLKDRINYILELKEKYKINMLLSELSSQSPSEVALIMLRRCYTEDLQAFLQDYLPTYATRHLFDIDEVLRNFVESETASSGGAVDGVRLEMILSSFRSLSNKLECLLNVLKVLDVPWSSTVFQLAINAAASATKDYTVSDSDHILAEEIQKELNYANVKVVLKKYNFPLTCTDYMLVLHRLIHASVVDLKDLKAVTTVMSSHVANYGNALYINKCLENCDTRSALLFFQDLSLAEKNILIKTTMTKYEQVINGSSQDKMVERNYIDFMKGTHMLNDIQLKNVDNLYHLKNSYSIELDMNSIYNEKICADKYNSWIQNDENARVSSGSGASITCLIPTCESKPSSLLMLLRGVSTTHRVRTLVETLLKSHLGTHHNPKDISSVLSQFKDGQNTSLLLEATNILIELLTRCEEDHFHDLMKHLSTLNALVNATVTVKNLTVAWKFNYVFLPISSGTAINEFIDILSKMISIQNIVEEKVLSIQTKCDFMPFRIISNAVTSSTVLNDDLIKKIAQLKGKVSKRLLSRVVASQELDEVLITILLVLLNNDVNEDADFCPLELLKGQSESLTPALSGFLSNPAICQIFDINTQGSPVAYPPQHILKSKFNINLSEITLPENNEETWDLKVILFYILKQQPDTTSERLVELCRALSVSINDGLSLQLIALLSTWDLKYKIFCDELGYRQIDIEEDSSLFERCAVIWENIDNKEFLKDVLKDFWKNGEVTLHGRVVSVNPYYYEVFVCIHHLIFGVTMDSNRMKEYYLLNFLKDYKRVSTPKQFEFELFSVKGMFPEIGHYRLPFHLFMRDDMWSNLKSEITLETYERWLPVVSLLSLDKDSQIAKDMICSNALKQTMTTRKRDDGTDNDEKEKEPWRLTSREEPLLRAAHRCVRHIANMEWAGACLFYVLQGCTRGADQVAAAHLCYQFAQRWAALQPGNRAVKQMERLHSTLSTRHVLFKIDWACEELVRLSTEPSQLIRTLYLHPEFVNKIARHDVNRAATEIADKNNINISSIRIQILENLLNKSTENKKDERSALNSKELMIAKYILKATCPKMGAIYLSRIAFDDDSDYNKCKKMRALQCLMSVVEPDTAMKVTNTEREALWKSLLELLSTVKLENIDMPWVVVTFMQDKCRALEQLLQAVDGNIDGLKITADLACHFGNTRIIRNLIPLLLRCGLVDEMIPLLVKIAGPPDAVICAAWRAVILSPFQRADYPITERQKLKCVNAINLLPICPIIKDDDLRDIWKNCVRLKSFGLGCLVLPYMTPQARLSLSELQKIDRRNLIASLKNLHAETYLVSGAMHVIERMASKVYK